MDMKDKTASQLGGSSVHESDQTQLVEEEINSLNEEGVPMQVFIESSKFLKGRHPEITEKILFGVGLTTGFSLAKVTWD